MKILDAVMDLFPAVVKVFDELHLSKEEKAQAALAMAELKAGVKTGVIQLESQLLKTRGDIILAEANGNVLQRSVRPFLLLICGLILLNNFVIFPYLAMFTDKAIVLDFPLGMYALMTTCIGGYFGLRSMDKKTITDLAKTLDLKNKGKQGEQFNGERDRDYQR